MSVRKGVCLTVHVLMAGADGACASAGVAGDEADDDSPLGLLPHQVSLKISSICFVVNYH